MRIIKRQILSISLVSSLFLTGCGSERLLQLKPLPDYWEAINFSNGSFEPVPKKQSARLLQTCQDTKNVVKMPKQYRTLDTYGLYFSLQNIGTYTSPIELQYIAQGNQFYLTCRSQKTFRLSAHPIKQADHPWLKQTSGQDRTPITAPTLNVHTSDKATKRKQEVVDVSNQVQRVSVELPSKGQLLLIEEEDGQKETIFGLPASFTYSEFELSLEKTTDGLPSTTFTLQFKGDQYLNQRDVLRNLGKRPVKLTYHPLPDTLPADKTIPYLTFRSTDAEQPVTKTISLRYETDVKDIPVHGFNGIGDDNKKIQGFLHPNDTALREADFRQLSLLSDKLAKQVADELKEVTLETPQGNRADVRYLTLIQSGKLQTFDVYLKARANKTDVYLKDIRTKKAAKLSGEVAANLLTEVEE